MNNSIPKEIKSILNSSGLPWEIERRKRHRFIKINGIPILTISTNKISDAGACRDKKNNLAIIKRHLRQIMSNQ